MIVPAQDIETATKAIEYLNECVGKAPLTRAEHVQAQQAYQFALDVIARLTSPPNQEEKPVNPEELSVEEEVEN